MSLEEYLGLPWHERYLLNDALDELIERANEDGEVRPRDLKR